MKSIVIRNIAAGAVAIAMVTLVTLTATAGCVVTGERAGDEGYETTVDEEMMIGMPSPIVEYDTLEEAEKAVGFKFKVPATITDYEEVSYSVISGELIQAIYRGESGEICIRKAIGWENISGDYNLYADAVKYTIRDREVVISGDGETAALATWTDKEYTYSIGVYDENGLARTSQGMSVGDMKNLVSVVK